MRDQRAHIISRLLPLESYRPHDPPPSDHAPAAVLVALIEHSEGLGLLLTLRTRHLRKHAGQIALPGGRSEPGETPWQTALREAHEEVGLDPDLVEVVGLSEPFWARSGYLITPVVGFVKPGFSVSPNPAEVDEVFEVPFEFVMDAGNHRMEPQTTAEGIQREVLAMPYQDRYIWGMTAMMLQVLHTRLYGASAA